MPAEDDKSAAAVSLHEPETGPGDSRMVNHCVWFLSGQMVPGESVRHVPINCSPFVIGRRPSVNLCLPCNAVSSVHAEVFESQKSLVLRDLGSTNGTYVNGKRILEPVNLEEDDLVQIAEITLRVLKQTAEYSTATISEDVYDRALALVQFDKLMSEQDVVPHYQPIVRLGNAQTIAYEVLGRSRIEGLETPAAMFRAAGRLNLEIELSRMFRWKGIQASTMFPQPPHLFVNTHPRELDGPGLSDSVMSIRELSSTQEITLEIHEAAVTNPAAMSELRAVLNDFQIGLACDDFGAGQTRMIELVEVRPDYLKFDMSLIRGIDRASAERQQLVATLVRMSRELGVIPLAEGIESEEESITCQQLGFELAQGYYFGKPAPAEWSSDTQGA